MTGVYQDVRGDMTYRGHAVSIPSEKIRSKVMLTPQLHRRKLVLKSLDSDDSDLFRKCLQNKISFPDGADSQIFLDCFELFACLPRMCLESAKALQVDTFLIFSCF